MSAIRPLQVRDADTLAALYIANQEFLDTVRPAAAGADSPPRGRSGVTSKALERERAADRLERFLIEAGGEPAGSSRSRGSRAGPSRTPASATGSQQGMNGRGIATRAVGLVCEWGFGEAGFHRLEAATLVDNIASQTVLRRNNFTEIGLSPRYLFIAGAWRDHILFARTVED